LSILDCGSRIANVSETHAPLAQIFLKVSRRATSTSSAVSAKGEAGCRFCKSTSGLHAVFERRSCVRAL